MRLEALARAGYYPLSPVVGEQIAARLSAPHGGRILDPCVGVGDALLQLAHALNLEPYGCELNPERAAAAAAAVATHLAARDPAALPHRDPATGGRVWQSDLRNLRVTPGSINLLYLNPPFDDDAGAGQRLELTFLKLARPWLQSGGILVLILPRRALRQKAVADYLVAHFEQLGVAAHPAGARAYDELSVLGVARSKAALVDDAQVAALQAVGRGERPLPSLDELTGTWRLPPLQRPGRWEFLPRSLPAGQVLAEAAAHGVTTTAAWRALWADGAATETAWRPLTPLRQGHLLNLIGAGYLNNRLLTRQDPTDGAPQSALVKGLTAKGVRTTRSVEMDEDGGTAVEVERRTEYFDTTIRVLDPATGQIAALTGDALEAFLATWLPALAEAVTAAYRPVYDFSLNGYGAQLATFNQGRSLPNAGHLRGLLPAQAHAAAAAATRLDDRHEGARDALVVGQMGSGKTLIGPAALQLAGQHRVIVLCPPHLTHKWEREVRHVLPGVRVMQLRSTADVDAFFRSAATREAPLYGVLKETTARDGSGWRHAYDWCGPAQQGAAERGKPLEDLAFASELVRTYWEHRQDDPEQRVTVHGRRVRLGALARYVAQLRGPRDPQTGQRLLVNDRPAGPGDFGRRIWRVAPGAAPLVCYDRRGQRGQARVTLRDALQRQSALVAGRPTTAWQAPARARWPLAGYIGAQWGHVAYALLADEVHQYKGNDSDRGLAFHRLVVRARKVLGLTGTVYGGKASTLFRLLYRLSRAVQGAYGYGEEARWVGQYGVLQEVVRTRVEAHGRNTGNRRSGVQVKELPGASPELVRWLLDRSVFVTLEDMGFALPEYREEPILLEADAAGAAQYAALERQLAAALKQALAAGDRTLLASYLSALVTWPDSMWREKVVRHPRTGQVVAAVGALAVRPGETAKERRVLADIRSSLAAGRKVLLLVEQTGTLDITPQWLEALGREGIRAAVLRCEPGEREAWLAEQAAAGTQVILSHPKRVETGLDILAYPEVMWLGPCFSVYTVKQVNRRPYRVTQTEAVRVRYYAYAGTLQEHALRLIAAKARAADRIDGNVLETDGLAELDELTQGDVLTQLANLLLTGAATLGEQSLQEAFAQANADVRQQQTYLGGYGPEHGPELLRPTAVDAEAATADATTAEAVTPEPSTAEAAAPETVADTATAAHPTRETSTAEATTPETAPSDTATAVQTTAPPTPQPEAETPATGPARLVFGRQAVGHRRPRSAAAPPAQLTLFDLT